jgi:hypothetical protein
VHPVVDQNDGNFFDVPLEQSGVVEDRPFDQGDIGKISEYAGDDLAGCLAEMAVRAAEESDGGWHVSRLDETQDRDTGAQHGHRDHP